MWSVVAAFAALAAVPPAAAETQHSAYVKYHDARGVVVTVSDGGFTLRLTRNAVAVVGQGRAARAIAVPRQADLDVRFADGGLVRWADVADAGPEGSTAAGRSRLKLPAGAPGWAADRAALRPGQTVEVTFVRPKDVPPSWVGPADVRARYVVIRKAGKT